MRNVLWQLQIHAVMRAKHPQREVTQLFGRGDGLPQNPAGFLLHRNAVTGGTGA